MESNWVTNFNWISPQSPVFAGLPQQTILGFEAAAVTPKFILQEIKPAAYDDVPAGIFHGWLNFNGALVLQAKVGQGTVLVTTFDVSQYGTEPCATILLRDMVNYVGSGQSKPQFELSGIAADRDTQTKP